MHWIFTLYILALATSIAGMEFFSGLIVIGSIAVLIKNKQLRSAFFAIPRSILFSGIGLISVAILSGFLNPDYSAKDLRFIVGGQRWLLLLVFITVGFQLVETRWKKGVEILFGLSVLIALYAIVQSFTGIDWVRSTEYFRDTTRGFGLWRAKGLFSNTMTYSYNFGFFTSLLFGVFLFKKFESPKSRALYVVGLSILGLSLFLTWTRGIWIAIACGLLAALFYKNKKAAMVTLAAGAISAVLLFLTVPSVNQSVQSITDSKYQSNSERLSIWKAYWHMYLDAPVIGRGYRLQSRYLPEYYEKLGISSEFISHAHNNVLQFLAGTGTLGALFYIVFSLLCLIYAHNLFKIIPESDELTKGWVVGCIAALVTFHVGGMTEANFVDGEVRHMLVFTLASLFAIGHKYKSLTESIPTKN